NSPILEKYGNTVVLVHETCCMEGSRGERRDCYDKEGSLAKCRTLKTSIMFSASLYTTKITEVVLSLRILVYERRPKQRYQWHPTR
ncbi:hypothetical protein L9F63_020513, partial [Diploptera punctata]